MKLWAGRFQKDTNKRVNDFNSSIHFDARMYEEDITGSIAHATMLGKCGIIDKDESEKIVAELQKLLSEINEGKIEFSVESEDIHMNIETMLTERLGDIGKKLHTARSRNDQVALDIKLYLRKEIGNVKELCYDLLKVLYEKGCENTQTIMPGYTHLQRAQPTTFTHHLMAYAQMIKRDITRLDDCYRRMDKMPLGSGALATTTYPIDRKFVSNMLEFEDITENSIDSVSDRDFVIELASVVSLIMMHLSRFSEEIIMWCSWEFAFIELDDAFSTGSSIMPQKKNPDVAELVRGKTGRVYGNLMTLLTMMKGIPLAYNKDMQEDKEAIFDSIDTVKICLEVFTEMFATCTIKTYNMRKAASGGYINATDCADYLVKKGLPFREAYKIVGTIVNYCIQNNEYLETLTLKDYCSICGEFGPDIYEAIALRTCVNGRNVEGGPGLTAVSKQLDSVYKFIHKFDKEYQKHPEETVEIKEKVKNNTGIAGNE